MEREYFGGTWQKERTFSPAVVTQGGRIVWLAGHGATVHDMGRPVAKDFDTQVREAFHNLAATLERAGGTLQDIVTMTVFVGDSRYGTRFVEIRGEFFPDGNYPGSALITCAGFARPEMLVEIQGIAVIDG